jgi:arylsulfatase A-like enzyme
VHDATANPAAGAAHLQEPPGRGKRRVVDGQRAVAAGKPANVVVLLLDSLNRHLLGAYGSGEFETPNLDRLARRALRFDTHYVGSLPCMPARHDLLCGALDFLWKPWGSIELWERPLTAALRRVGVVTQLISDHPHLFESGGENYHCEFTAWDYQRGHETDAWRTRPDPSWVGAPSFHRGHTPYDNSRGYFRGEEDFPGPRTMAAAARWLDDNAAAHERFFLFIDEFDPHEPFDTPEPWASKYDPEWRGPHLIWPPYIAGARAAGALSEREARQLRACYGAKLSMIDAWVGRVLDALDRNRLWDTTAVFLCTDHGHYLGEKDVWGKPAVPIYEPLGHIPLLVAWPGATPRQIPALTTNVDLCATWLDLFGAELPQRRHGRSLLPLLCGSTETVRDWALAGVWGREVHLMTREWKYARAPRRENAPLSLWSNRWSTMPLHGAPDLRLPDPDERAYLDRMPGSSIPVIRQPFAAGDVLPYWASGQFHGNQLYRQCDDPGEERNLVGEPIEQQAAELLRAALREVEAPPDHLARLGLR